jgi:hypothetical protein
VPDGIEDRPLALESGEPGGAGAGRGLEQHELLAAGVEDRRAPDRAERGEPHVDRQLAVLEPPAAAVRLVLGALLAVDDEAQELAEARRLSFDLDPPSGVVYAPAFGRLVLSHEAKATRPPSLAHRSED